MPLSAAAVTVLTRAADRPDHRLAFHRRLPIVARRKMIEALLREGLAGGDAGVTPASEDPDSGLVRTALVLTDAGFRAIGRVPPTATAVTAGNMAAHTPTETSGRHKFGEDTAAAHAPHRGLVGRPRTNLRQAAVALLTAWDDRQGQPTALAGAIERIRSALATTPSRTPREPRPPRAGTKQQAVLALLRRPEGTTIAQIVAATAWAQHTVRGFLANLKRKGITVEVLERIRQAGPGSTGAKGSYSVHRIGGEN